MAASPLRAVGERERVEIQYKERKRERERGGMGVSRQNECDFHNGSASDVKTDEGKLSMAGR